MAGSLTNWGENAALDSMFGGSSECSTAIANLYISLWKSTGGVSDATDGGSTGECAGSTYARVAVANTSAAWANCTGGIKLLKAGCTFTTAAGADWGTIGFICIGTSGTTGGQLYCWSTVASGAKTINAGDTVIVSSGYSITIT